MGSAQSVSSEEAEASQSTSAEKERRLKQELAETTAALNSLIHNGHQAAAEYISFNRSHPSRNSHSGVGSDSSTPLVETTANSPRQRSDSTSDGLPKIALNQSTNHDANKENVSEPKPTDNTKDTNEVINLDDDESLDSFLFKLVSRFDTLPRLTTEDSDEEWTPHSETDSKQNNSPIRDSASDSVSNDSEQNECTKENSNKSSEKPLHCEKNYDENRGIDSEQERDLLQSDEENKGKKENENSHKNVDVEKSEASSSDTEVYDLDLESTDNDEERSQEEQVNEDLKVPSSENAPNNEKEKTHTGHLNINNDIMEKDVMGDSANEDEAREKPINAESDVENSTEAEREDSTNTDFTSTERSESETKTESEDESSSRSEDASSGIAVDDDGLKKSSDKSNAASDAEMESPLESEQETGDRSPVRKRKNSQSAAENIPEVIEIKDAIGEEGPIRKRKRCVSGTEHISEVIEINEDAIGDEGPIRKRNLSLFGNESVIEVIEIKEEAIEEGPIRKRRKSNTSETSSSTPITLSSGDEDEESLSPLDSDAHDLDTEESSDSDEGNLPRHVSMVRRSYSKGTQSVPERTSPNREGEAKEVRPRRRPKRRNKRKKIINDDSLKLSTIKAIEEERKKTLRMKERRKKFNITDVDETNHNKLTKLDLDYDSKTGAPIISVDAGLLGILKPHQANGVLFMWEVCFESVEQITAGDEGHGCILAHCMGLGKTLQVVTLIHTLLSHRSTRVRRVLVVCPKSTALNWCNEFRKWLARAEKDCELELYEISGVTTMSSRLHRLRTWMRTGGVFVLGYEMFRNLAKLTKNPQDKDKKTNNKKTENNETGLDKKPNDEDTTSKIKDNEDDGNKTPEEEAKSKPAPQKLSEDEIKTIKEALLDPGPDLVVCDEGHLLKNEEAQVSQAFSLVRTRRRVVLTGTPLQNNLKEYYCMVSFVKKNLLGTEEEYNNRFVYPIVNGQFVDSNEDEIQKMKRQSHVLHKLLEQTIQRKDGSILNAFLPPKFEYVLFITLTPLQIELYDHFLKNYANRDKKIIPRVGNFKIFRDFQTFLRIHTHPLTLKHHKTKEIKRINKENEKNRMRIRKKRIEKSDIPLSWYKVVVEKRKLADLRLSNKLIVLFDMLRRCADAKEKILVFSQSLYTLNVIEFFLKEANKAHNEGNSVAELNNYSDNWVINVDYFRLDGSSSASDRAEWCEKFNNTHNHTARLFLISTRAGGLGINLVAANRVVLFDVSWNPSHDVQSIFRIYRIGQDKRCFVYRFISMGTIEQKMYNRQVIKLSVAKRVVDEEQVERHYTEEDLTELYQLDASPPPRPLPAVPRDDDMLAGVINQHQCIHEYHVHDSLLADIEEERLSEAERAEAWRQFERERAADQPGAAPLDPVYALLTGSATAASLTGINEGASTSGIVQTINKSNAIALPLISKELLPKDKSLLQKSLEQKKTERKEKTSLKAQLKQKSQEEKLRLKQEKEARRLEESGLKREAKEKQKLLKVQETQTKQRIGEALRKIIPYLPNNKHKIVVNKILKAGLKVQRLLLNLATRDASPHGFIVNNQMETVNVFASIAMGPHKTLGMELMTLLQKYSFPRTP